MADQLRVRWTGEAFVPTADEAYRATRLFRPDTTYQMQVSLDRSKARNWYHARIRELWESLPEDVSMEFPSPRHLRQYALIRTGWFKRKAVDMGTEDAAQKLVAYEQHRDEVVVCIVTADNPSLVQVFTARSQSDREMPDKDEWNRSREDVIAFIEKTVGIEDQKEEAD